VGIDSDDAVGAKAFHLLGEKRLQESGVFLENRLIGEAFIFTFFHMFAKAFRRAGMVGYGQSDEADPVSVFEQGADEMPCAKTVSADFTDAFFKEGTGADGKNLFHKHRPSFIIIIPHHLSGEKGNIYL